MYAVIRAGGKQYRVAPGDVIRVEKLATGTDGRVNFPEVLAVSGGEGKIGTFQAEKAVQETAWTPSVLHGCAHHRNRL
jgi:large subunit ribosomal protein L21